MDIKSSIKNTSIQIKWLNILLMSLIHLSALYGFYLLLFHSKYETALFIIVLWFISGCVGIECGVHRFWSHKTYKARYPLQLFMILANTMAFQNAVYYWSRDHRVHHKFSDTDADPHNSNRGFFFSHVGWLLCKKNPEVSEKGKCIDVSDLENDNLVQFQRKYYLPLLFIFWAFIPTIIPYYLWNESLLNSFFTCVMFRYAFVSNVTWFVNSASHLWGKTKPYDKNIKPRETIIRHLMLGAGFHNYHHTFPMDYSGSEFGASEVFNPATTFIDLMAKIGLAYDLKKVSKDVIQSKKLRSGDVHFTKNSTFLEYSTGILTIISIPLIVSLNRFIFSKNFTQQINY